MRPKNQIHDTIIQLAVNNTNAKPLYFNALVPITPTISKSACGFNKDTEQANKICFFAGIASPSFTLDGTERQIVMLI